MAEGVASEPSLLGPQGGALLSCGCDASISCEEDVAASTGLLEERHTIPMVAAELELIQDLLRDEWWQDVSIPMLENVRQKLRSLIGLIERQSQEPLYSDFSDELVGIKELDAAGLLSNDEFTQSRLRAQEFLKTHQDHLSMQLRQAYLCFL